MADFVFRAASLYDADMAPDPDEGYLHEGADLGQKLAKQKRLAFWLKNKLELQAVSSSNVVWSQSGWEFTVNGKDGFLYITIDLEGDDEKPFLLLIARIGDIKSEYARTKAAFERIFRDNPEVELVEMRE